MSKSQETRITWLGHATVLIQTAQGTNILIDPFIAHNPKYPKSFELPEKIHYVLLTHGHGDHISDAAPVAKKHGSTVVAIYELADYIAKQGVTKTMGMNLGGSVTLNDVTVTIRARTMWASPPASCSPSLEVPCSTTLETLPSSATCNSSVSFTSRASRCCPSAATTPWTRRKPRSPAVCSRRRRFSQSTSELFRRSRALRLRSRFWWAQTLKLWIGSRETKSPSSDTGGLKSGNSTLRDTFLIERSAALLIIDK
jgi:Beta-lactamase superfamily domain